jgi:single-stranded-DNA-specific exonuclease
MQLMFHVSVFLHMWEYSLSQHGSQLEIDAIAFNTTDEDWSNEQNQAKVAYRLDVNVFRGRQSLQLMVEHIELV